MSDTSSLRNYLLLRGALLTYQMLPWQLSAEEQNILAQAVTREELMMLRALDSHVGNELVLDDALVQQEVENFKASISSLGDMEQILSEAGLPKSSLVTSIESEMRAAQVLECLTSTVIPTEQEVHHWYEANLDRFVVPERREVFHILITVNEDYAENRREAARQRIDELALQARLEPTSFSELAKCHSECPSAFEGGRLGAVPPGHLYPSLDSELFALESGGISRVVESPLGFHLLRCGQIELSRRLAWSEVRESLTRRLTEISRKRFLRQWLNGIAAKQATCPK